MRPAWQPGLARVAQCLISLVLICGISCRHVSSEEITKPDEHAIKDLQALDGSSLVEVRAKEVLLLNNKQVEGVVEWDDDEDELGDEVEGLVSSADRELSQYGDDDDSGGSGSTRRRKRRRRRKRGAAEILTSGEMDATAAAAAADTTATAADTTATAATAEGIADPLSAASTADVAGTADLASTADAASTDGGDLSIDTGGDVSQGVEVLPRMQRPRVRPFGAEGAEEGLDGEGGGARRRKKKKKKKKKRFGGKKKKRAAAGNAYGDDDGDVGGSLY